MTFAKTNLEYRIVFDTQKNMFMAIDKHDETRAAYGVTIEKAIKTATLNPATILNLKNKGMIAPEYDADLVIFNQNFEILHTIINGKIYGEN